MVTTKNFINYITILKVICLALLFSPLWGFWWFDINPDLWAGYGSVFVTYVWIQYFLVKSISAIIVYTLVSLLAFMGFVIVSFVRPNVVRIPLLLVMLTGWGFELSMLDLNGGVSNQDLMWVFWQNWASGPTAVEGYARYIIRDWAFVAILGIVLCAPPSRRFSVSGIFGLLPIVSLAAVTATAAYTKGGTSTFPIPFGTFANAAIVALSVPTTPSAAENSSGSNPLHDVVMTRNTKIEGGVHPIFNKIIMIMDESVRGDSIPLNNSAQNSTPFLKASHDLINFGVAISGGNCSFISRSLLRFGMRESDLPDHWREGLTRPTIWQFAHEAGYKNVHIDASFPHNDLSPAEMSLIDSNINISDHPGYLRDQKLVGALLHALQEKEPTFIYVDKYGTHFPYSTKYPADFHPFPTSAEWNARKTNIGFIDVFLNSFLTTEKTTADAVQLLDLEIAQYPNAIAWSVDEFFRKLLPAVDLSRTLIVYTSDHGQSLLPRRFTHCSTDPHAVVLGEVYVPLFVSTLVPDFREDLQKGAVDNFGWFSHFEIFPTLLLGMGYNKIWVNIHYGPTLMDPPSRDRKFMIGSPMFRPTMISADRE